MITIHLLQQGPSILGAYSNQNLAGEALAQWCDEFLQRFGRCALLNELPTLVEMRIDEKPGKESIVRSASAN
jgi:hypothetical protein